ncbi:MAG: hypothetical protein L0H23_00650 [Luteimonas sp.]|nr:hypothetical protein [Luteimonas sp.]
MTTYNPVPFRFRAADSRRVVLLHGVRGEEATYAAIADHGSLRIRRPGPKRKSKRKVAAQ